jgi:hypothetical protein
VADAADAAAELEEEADERTADVDEAAAEEVEEFVSLADDICEEEPLEEAVLEAEEVDELVP